MGGTLGATPQQRRSPREPVSFPSQVADYYKRSIKMAAVVYKRRETPGIDTGDRAIEEDDGAFAPLPARTTTYPHER